jgi:hypothetical protein
VTYRYVIAYVEMKQYVTGLFKFYFSSQGHFGKQMQHIMFCTVNMKVKITDADDEEEWG